MALGDSSTEGLDDPKEGGGFRGWSERLASHIAAEQGPLEYANLAVRGKDTAEVRLEQLGAALALEPDFATLFVGTNDVTAPSFDDGLRAAAAEQLGLDYEAKTRYTSWAGTGDGAADEDEDEDEEAARGESEAR